MVTVILEIDPIVVEKAREFAQQTKQPVESILSGWLSTHSENMPLEDLPDNLLMKEVHIMMDEPRQKELSALLEKNGEGLLDDTEKARMHELVQYTQELTLYKAKAIREAVLRGVIPPINEWTDPEKPPMGSTG
ncbi:MAG: hypothetical protein ACPG7F_10050 [Aggregatilineales bacterium]